VEGDTEDGQKKCDDRRRSTKQKSQQSLDSASQLLPTAAVESTSQCPTAMKSADTLQSAAAANADDAAAAITAADAVDSDLAVVDSNVTASEESWQLQESIIGLLPADC